MRYCRKYIIYWNFFEIVLFGVVSVGKILFVWCFFYGEFNYEYIFMVEDYYCYEIYKNGGVIVFDVIDCVGSF